MSNAEIRPWFFSLALDAAAVVEVIEHLDPPRLAAFTLEPGALPTSHLRSVSFFTARSAISGRFFKLFLRLWLQKLDHLPR